MSWLKELPIENQFDNQTFLTALNPHIFANVRVSKDDIAKIYPN